MVIRGASENWILLGHVQILLGSVLLHDEGKRCAETLFMDYHNQNQVAIKIIRIFVLWS
jgi:UDP-glucuronate decarboxylase